MGAKETYDFVMVLAWKERRKVGDNVWVDEDKYEVESGGLVEAVRRKDCIKQDVVFLRCIPVEECEIEEARKQLREREAKRAIADKVARIQSLEQEANRLRHEIGEGL